MINVNLKGKITSVNGLPVTNAIVTLVRQNMKDTTGSDGLYSLIKNGTAVLAPVAPHAQNITLENGILKLTLTNSSPIKVEIFDIQGNLLTKRSLQKTPYGVYRMDISGTMNSSKVIIINATIGNQKWSYRYLPLNQGKYSLNNGNNVNNIGTKFFKLASVMDTIKVSANGFVTKSVAITSYNQELNITLDSISSNLTGKSAGCGKPLASLKSGTYTIEGSGRQYILNVPANYDPNKAYRLIFGYHWVGGTMTDVATGQTVPDKPAWAYYGLKRIADSTGNYCIFVAPQGLGNGWGSGDKDLTFFDDMVKLFKGELCVDTTRIFSIGFSFGGAMSYKLARARPKVLRAVCVQDGGMMSGDFNSTTPIAYMGVVGMSDGVCPPATGHSLRDKFVVTNTCTKPGNVPETTVGSKSHVVYDYQGCDSRYPVKWCTFDGAHIAAPYDGGSGDSGKKTWIPLEAWKFFTQF